MNDRIKLDAYQITKNGTVYKVDTACTNESREYVWIIYKKKGCVKELDGIDLTEKVEV